jgi:hypothetical protein
MGALFSYCVRYDGGAAPNPFWGVCTLVICKPRIRRAAGVGDWIVGTGSRRSPAGDLSGAVVYAMRVGRKLSMPQYDEWAAADCPGKISDPGHADRRRAAGDAVYDFSTDPPRVRPSDHTEANRDVVCGFDFGAVYGAEFAGFIHVHHLRPLSEIRGEYVVDPVADLCPVCPNCHAVIHHGGRVRSVEEVRQLLGQQQLNLAPLNPETPGSASGGDTDEGGRTGP